MRISYSKIPVRSIAALLTIFALAGCETVTPRERLQMDRGHCRAIGFPDHTVPMAECVQRMELDRHADRRANRVAMDRWMYDRPYAGPWHHHHRYRRW